MALADGTEMESMLGLAGMLCRMVNYRYSCGNSLNHPHTLLHVNHVVP